MTNADRNNRPGPDGRRPGLGLYGGRALRSVVIHWSGRIFWRYALAFAGVALGVALISGALHVVASYRGTRDAVFESLAAKAVHAALVTESFFDRVRRPIMQAGQLNLLPPGQEEALRKIEFIRIHRNNPAIADLSYVDRSGYEHVRLSRTLADITAPDAERDESAAFLGALHGGRYVGAVFFEGGSEPHVVLSSADAGRDPGVTVANVNLMSLWEDLATVRVGAGGYVYVTDTSGQLVSHSDRSLVLTNKNISRTSQYQTASAAGGRRVEGLLEGSSHDGRDVFYAYASIPSLNWTVFAEIPVDEAMLPFYLSLGRSGSVLFIGLMLALLASLLLADRMSAPIKALRMGAERISRGEMDERVLVHSRDELGELALQFNTMAQQIRARNEALRLSEERYALATRGARDGIWDWDLASGEVYYSGRWRLLVGDPEEATTASADYWLSKVAAEDRDAVLDAIHAHIAGRSSQLHCEYRVVRPDGSRQWMLARGLAIRSADGKAYRLAGSQSDISALKSALDEIEAHRDHLEALVEERSNEARAARQYLLSAIQTAPDGLIMLNEKQETIVANDRCAELLGPVDPSGSPVAPGEALARLTSLCRDCEIKIKRLHEDGSVFVHQLELGPSSWVEISGRRMTDGGYVIRISDISTYKQAESSLRAALAKELELNEIQRNFVSMTSHQFRTPLAIIDSSAQRLIRRVDVLERAEVSRRAQLIREAVGRMTRLMESTLSLAQMDAGTISFRPRGCNLKDLIAAACSVQSEMIPDRIFVADLEGLPTEVECDPVLLEQVLSNLISNAVKFSSEGSRITVKGWQDGSDVAFSVSDTGIGIPEFEIEKISQRFFRASNAAGVAGSGIGLNLVREIVALHGGAIDISSVVGSGTTFTIRLPAAGALLNPVSRGRAGGEVGSHSVH